MATSTIPHKLYCSEPVYATGATTVTVDVTKYKNGTTNGGFAFLVAARSWAGSGFEAVGALYLVSGIYVDGNTFQSAVAIKRENATYSPTVTISGNTLSIKFINSGGGQYSIIPICNYF